MNILLSAIRIDETLNISKIGETLIINGEEFDFSRIGEGDTLPSNAINSIWFIGDQTRVDGELVLSMFLPNPRNYSPEQAFPEPLIDVQDGFITLPKPLDEEV